MAEIRIREMPVGYKRDGSVRLWSQTEEVQLEHVLSAKEWDKSHGKTFRENLFREARMIGYQAEASVGTSLYDRINGRVVQDNAYSKRKLIYDHGSNFCI